MPTYSELDLTAEDDIYGERLPDGHLAQIIINGSSPNAQATLWLFDDEQRRYRQLDRLVEVEVKEGPRGSVQLRGLSTFLIEEVQVGTEEEMRVSITARPARVDAR